MGITGITTRGTLEIPVTEAEEEVGVAVARFEEAEGPTTTILRALVAVIATLHTTVEEVVPGAVIHHIRAEEMYIDPVIGPVIVTKPETK